MFNWKVSYINFILYINGKYYVYMQFNYMKSVDIYS